MIYPLVNLCISIENGSFVVDLPIKHGGFPICFVCLPDGNQLFVIVWFTTFLGIKLAKHDPSLIPAGRFRFTSMIWGWWWNTLAIPLPTQTICVYVLCSCYCTSMHHHVPRSFHMFMTCSCFFESPLFSLLLATHSMNEGSHHKNHKKKHWFYSDLWYHH